MKEGWEQLDEQQLAQGYFLTGKRNVGYAWTA